VQGMRAVQHARWQGLDPSMGFDPTGGLLDPNTMALALARAGQGGLLLPQGAQQQHSMQALQASFRPAFAYQLLSKSFICTCFAHHMRVASWQHSGTGSGM
jgi:hypothetical protein